MIRAITNFHDSFDEDRPNFFHLEDGDYTLEWQLPRNFIVVSVYGPDDDNNTITLVLHDVTRKNIQEKDIPPGTLAQELSTNVTEWLNQRGIYAGKRHH